MHVGLIFHEIDNDTVLLNMHYTSTGRKRLSGNPCTIRGKRPALQNEGDQGINSCVYYLVWAWTIWSILSMHS